MEMKHSNKENDYKQKMNNRFW